MREVKVAQLCKQLVRSPSGPLLGLDVGTRFVGIAVSDAEYKVARPHSVLERKRVENVCSKFAQLVKDLSVQGIVVGYPLRLSGFQGKQGPLVQQFVDQLHLSEQLRDVPYVYWDERLTSKQVDIAVRFVKLDPRRKKRILDKMAALCILQSCLDNMSKNRDHHLLASESL